MDEDRVVLSVTTLILIELLPAITLPSFGTVKEDVPLQFPPAAITVEVEGVMVTFPSHSPTGLYHG